VAALVNNQVGNSTSGSNSTAADGGGQSRRVLLAVGDGSEGSRPNEVTVASGVEAEGLGNVTEAARTMLARVSEEMSEIWLPELLSSEFSLTSWWAAPPRGKQERREEGGRCRCNMLHLHVV
jgi:hypothetical protein